jgi:hypothetical protein
MFNKVITVQFKSIGIEYRQILALQVSAIPQSILHSKTIADTITDTEKVSAILPIPILYCDINNLGGDDSHNHYGWGCDPHLL